MVLVKELILILLFISVGVNTYPHFTERLPNAKKLKNIDGSTIAAIGHIDPRGGRSLNPFGEAFKLSGFRWSQALCEDDSDGDGKTNGEELGDPDCQWIQGNKNPGEDHMISHPGQKESVCSPQV